MISVKRLMLAAVLLLSVLPAAGQADRHDVRAGNRKFRKDKFKEAEIDYRKAVLKDSTSMKAQYNLASALYRQEDWEGAKKALDAVASGDAPAQYHYNAGDVALQRKDYAAAVKSFREALLLAPDDLDAKENYIYAKKMLENQQGGGGGQGQNQDQNQDQNQQDQSQNQNQQNDSDSQDKRDSQPQDDGRQEISPQQARQMLNAVQAKEKETRDKVNKEKAALLKSKQKEKNW